MHRAKFACALQVQYRQLEGEFSSFSAKPCSNRLFSGRKSRTYYSSSLLLKIVKERGGSCAELVWGESREKMHVIQSNFPLIASWSG
jgi:hypothetical protein